MTRLRRLMILTQEPEDFRFEPLPTQLRRLSRLEERCIATLCYSAHLHQTD